MCVSIIHSFMAIYGHINFLTYKVNHNDTFRCLYVSCIGVVKKKPFDFTEGIKRNL